MIGRGRPLTADELARFRADSRQPHAEMRTRLPISAVDLAAYRRFAEDAADGDEPRSPIILRLLDEIQRLKAAFVPRPYEYQPPPPIKPHCLECGELGQIADGPGTTASRFVCVRCAARHERVDGVWRTP